MKMGFGLVSPKVYREDCTLLFI